MLVIYIFKLITTYSFTVNNLFINQLINILFLLIKWLISIIICCFVVSSLFDLLMYCFCVFILYLFINKEIPVQINPSPVNPVKHVQP